MKKTIRTILYAAVFAVLAVSCQKEINGVEPETNTKETIEISINGLMGEYTQVDATKSELVYTVRVSWKAGDVVYVYDGAQCLGSLIASLDGTEDRYALLSTDDTHTVSAPASGTKLTLVHSPLLTEAPAVSEGAISISLASQSGTKAPFVAYATLDYTGTTITDALVPFKFATSVIRVNCTGLTANTAIDNATLSNVNTKCKLTLSGTTAPTVSSDTNGTITRTGDEYFAANKVNTEGEAVFQIAVPKLEKTSGARVLTVAQGSDKVKDKKFATNSLAPATSVKTVCQLVGPPAGALPGEFSVSNDGGTTIEQVHFSQGNLWYGKVGDEQTATFNFEANQYDTTPASDNSWSADNISHFFWSKTASVAYAEGYNDGSASDSDVFFTNETVTTSKNDFTVNVGGTEQTGWRTLSTAEWQYLFNDRTDAASKVGYATVGGVNGIIILPDSFTDPKKNNNGSGAFVPKSSTVWDQNVYTSGDNWNAMETAGAVFLPAASDRLGSDVFGVGDKGYYWSSTPSYSNFAYFVFFNSDDVSPDSNDYRGICCSVRLVTESK